jgi:hypothetical protein
MRTWLKTMRPILLIGWTFWIGYTHGHLAEKRERLAEWKVLAAKSEQLAVLTTNFMTATAEAKRLQTNLNSKLNYLTNFSGTNLILILTNQFPYTNRPANRPWPFDLIQPRGRASWNLVSLDQLRR